MFEGALQDLVDERQIGQIEALQKRLNSALEAKYAEQKKIFQRGLELRKEITELRERFDQDIARTLRPDQQKTLAGRKAEIEKKRKEYLAKRAAAYKEAQRKREAAKKRKSSRRHRLHSLRPTHGDDRFATVSPFS